MSGTKRWSVYDPFDQAGLLKDSKPIWTPNILSLFEGLPIPNDPDIFPLETWTVDGVAHSPYVSDGRAFLAGAASSLTGMGYADSGTEWIRRGFEAGMLPGGGEPSEEARQKLLDYILSTIHRRIKFLSPYASALVTDLEF